MYSRLQITPEPGYWYLVHTRYALGDRSLLYGLLRLRLSYGTTGSTCSSTEMHPELRMAYKKCPRGADTVDGCLVCPIQYDVPVLRRPSGIPLVIVPHYHGHTNVIKSPFTLILLWCVEICTPSKLRGDRKLITLQWAPTEASGPGCIFAESAYSAVVYQVFEY